MEKTKHKILAVLCAMLVVCSGFSTACSNKHEHNYINGICECGELDPDYTFAHKHNYVDGVCKCGEKDPNYTPPHTHKYTDGVCECGEKDPNYTPPHTHKYTEGVCECGGIDIEYDWEKWDLTPLTPNQLYAPQKFDLYSDYSGSSTSYRLEWEKVENATEYEITVGDNVLTTSGTNLVVTKYVKENVGLFIYIKAIDGTSTYQNSKIQRIAVMPQAATPSLTYQLKGGTYSVSGGTKSLDGVAVVIPDYYKNKAVTQINDSAFCGTTITGSGSTKLGKISAVTLPKHLKIIGECAFMGAGIEKLTIPESVTVIKKWAFTHAAIKEVNFLSKNIEEFGAFCFNNDWCYSAGDRVILGNVLLRYNTDEEYVKTPEECSVVSLTGFNFKKIKILEFSDSVTKLDNEAIEIDTFRFNTQNLKIMVIPQNIKKLSGELFTRDYNFDEPTYKIYYKGTAEQFANVEIITSDKVIVSDTMKKRMMYYYSESEPPVTEDGLNYAGNFWYYKDGIPTPWIKGEGVEIV